MNSQITSADLTPLYTPAASLATTDVPDHSSNSFQAIAPLTAHEKGVHFLGEHISLKMGPFAPFLATIQALSKARAFLSS
jgi:hypothetical protein